MTDKKSRGSEEIAQTEPIDGDGEVVSDADEATPEPVDPELTVSAEADSAEVVSETVEDTDAIGSPEADVTDDGESADEVVLADEPDEPVAPGPDETATFPVIRAEPLAAAPRVDTEPDDADALSDDAAGLDDHEAGEPRLAQLRLVQIEPWSVTRLAFAVSVALMIVSVVAVVIFWTVLTVTGVWGQVNDAVNAVLSNDDSSFDISSYFGLPRLVGLSLVLSAVNVVFMTALAAVGAHLYNAAAQLLGGLEVTFSDR